MKLEKNMKILIVGLGLIGGSYAEALSENGYFVGGLDPDSKTVDYALAHNFVKIGKTAPESEYISQFDLIIFAVYEGVILDWICKNQQFIKKNAIISDVTGIKSTFIYKLQELLRPDLEFIGAHPMAGRESSGIKNATPNIFKGANFIITPTEKNSEGAVELCRDLGVLLGFSSISVLSPEKHDEVISFLSQLTHCIAISLMTCRDMSGMAEYSGDSFRDLTRIAKINDKMWSELFLQNNKTLLKEMDLFKESFDRLYALISNGEREKLCKLMQESTKNRELFDKRKGYDSL